MARKRRGQPVHGWIILDKPLGMSSSRAVGAVRRLLDAAKAGHGGTLDPLATGVLPIALGEATKTVSYAMEARKTYRFTLRWGEARAPTMAKALSSPKAPSRPSARADIGGALPAFTGTIQQRAAGLFGDQARRASGPMTWPGPARRPISCRGRSKSTRLRLARACPTPTMPNSRPRCGKGTYIRALGRDLGLALGTLGLCYGAAASCRRPVHPGRGDFPG